jgi:TIR domain
MQKATVECERTIAVFSPNYFLPEFAEAEWTAAFRRDPTGKNEKLIPVRIEDCQPPGRLGSGAIPRYANPIFFALCPYS